MATGPHDVATPVVEPSFSDREARILLWLVVAAVCGRWLLGVRAPLPTLDACADLWHAAQLVGGAPGALAAVWPPGAGLGLVPALAAGAEPFVAAQVLACVLGGLVLWPVAVVAQRLRRGAGVPAAIVALPLAADVAAAGSPAAGAGLLAAITLAAVLRRRGVLAGLCGLLTVSAALRSGVASLVPVLAPVAAVAAGLALARLHARWRDVVLCVAVLAAGFLSVRAAEPEAAVAERVLGRWLRHHVDAGRTLVTMAPRVAFFAGHEPRAVAAPDLFVAAAADPVQAVVLTAAAARDTTLTATLASRFARYDLPADLQDLCREWGLVLFWRRE